MTLKLTPARLRLLRQVRDSLIVWYPSVCRSVNAHGRVVTAAMDALRAGGLVALPPSSVAYHGAQWKLTYKGRAALEDARMQAKS